MKATEENKLIAEFMGINNLSTQSISIFDEPNLKYFRKTSYEIDGLCPYCHNDVSHGHNSRCYKLDDQKIHYHSSWDWLMPVIEKINYGLEMPNGDYFQVSIGKHKTSIFRKDKQAVPYLSEEICSGGGTMIENTFYAVIEFIKWYNQNPKS